MISMGNSSSNQHTSEGGRLKHSKRKQKHSKRKQNQHGAACFAGYDHDYNEGVKSVREENYVCDFSPCSDICICVVTWNMNGQVCYKDLEEMVARNNRKFDLLVIGLQEVPRKKISRLLQTALVDSHMLLGKATMQSIHLYVFGLKGSDLFLRGEQELADCQRQMKTDKLSVGGCGGLIGRKKGAVGIRINYKRVPMVFISCHLSAHAHNVGKRNSEYKSVSDSLFSKNSNPYASPPKIIVWLGDLNYRIQGIETHSVRNLINKELHGLLTSNDQLLQEADRGEIFEGYHEGTITFKPTYKYDVGSSTYDTSYKVRVPSWTDRILFKTEDDTDGEFQVTLHSYESMDEISSSDHKPVKAHICLKLNK